MITCEERRDLMMLYVTGALEPAEAAEVRGHLLGGCPACAGALAEAEATVHRIPESLRPVAVPSGAWEKIEKRIALAAGTGRGVEVGGERRRVWSFRTVGMLIGAAAAIVLIGWLLLEASELAGSNKVAQEEIALLVRERDAARQQATDSEKLRLRLADLERQVQKMENDNKVMMASLEQAQTNYVAKIERLMHADQFAIAPAQDKGATGTLFWNKGDGTWTVMASNLKPLPAGRCYEMWIVTAKGEKLAAGTFDPTPSGTAMYEMKLPADVGPIQLAAVTDEPLGGVAKATGQIQFLSDVTKKQ